MTVKLVTVSYGVENPPEEFPTLREALEALNVAVDYNYAAPGRLTMPTTVIGAAPVAFTAMQLYAMLSLVREDEE